MQRGNGGIGSKKHGVSGKPTKSPKLRHHMMLDAKKNDIKEKPTNCKYDSISELFRRKS